MLKNFISLFKINNKVKSTKILLLIFMLGCVVGSPIMALGGGNSDKENESDDDWGDSGYNNRVNKDPTGGTQYNISDLAKTFWGQGKSTVTIESAKLEASKIQAEQRSKEQKLKQQEEDKKKEELVESKVEEFKPLTIAKRAQLLNEIKGKNPEIIDQLVLSLNRNNIKTTETTKSETIKYIKSKVSNKNEDPFLARLRETLNKKRVVESDEEGEEEKEKPKLNKITSNPRLNEAQKKMESFLKTTLPSIEKVEKIQNTAAEKALKETKAADTKATGMKGADTKVTESVLPPPPPPPLPPFFGTPAETTTKTSPSLSAGDTSIVSRTKRSTPSSIGTPPGSGTPSGNIPLSVKSTLVNRMGTFISPKSGLKDITPQKTTSTSVFEIPNELESPLVRFAYSLTQGDKKNVGIIKEEAEKFCDNISDKGLEALIFDNDIPKDVDRHLKVYLKEKGIIQEEKQIKLEYKDIGTSKLLAAVQEYAPGKVKDIVPKLQKWVDDHILEIRGDQKVPNDIKDKLLSVANRDKVVKKLLAIQDKKNTTKQITWIREEYPLKSLPNVTANYLSSFPLTFMDKLNEELMKEGIIHTKIKDKDVMAKILNLVSEGNLKTMIPNITSDQKTLDDILINLKPNKSGGDIPIALSPSSSIITPPSSSPPPPPPPPPSSMSKVPPPPPPHRSTGISAFSPSDIPSSFELALNKLKEKYPELYKLYSAKMTSPVGKDRTVGTDKKKVSDIATPPLDPTTDAGRTYKLHYTTGDAMFDKIDMESAIPKVIRHKTIERVMDTLSKEGKPLTAEQALSFFSNKMDPLVEQEAEKVIDELARDPFVTSNAGPRLTKELKDIESWKKDTKKKLIFPDKNEAMDEMLTTKLDVLKIPALYENAINRKEFTRIGKQLELERAKTTVDKIIYASENYSVLDKSLVQKVVLEFVNKLDELPDNVKLQTIMPNSDLGKAIKEISAHDESNRGAINEVLNKWCSENFVRLMAKKEANQNIYKHVDPKILGNFVDGTLAMRVAINKPLVKKEDITPELRKEYIAQLPFIKDLTDDELANILNQTTVYTVKTMRTLAEAKSAGSIAPSSPSATTTTTLVGGGAPPAPPPPAPSLLGTPPPAPPPAPGTSPPTSPPSGVLSTRDKNLAKLGELSKKVAPIPKTIPPTIPNTEIGKKYFESKEYKEFVGSKHLEQIKNRVPASKRLEAIILQYTKKSFQEKFPKVSEENLEKALSIIKDGTELDAEYIGIVTDLCDVQDEVFEKIATDTAFMNAIKSVSVACHKIIVSKASVVPGDGSTVASTAGSTATSTVGSTATPGDGSTATPGAVPTATSGDGSTATPGDGSATTSTVGSTVTPGGGAAVTSTDGSIITPGGTVTPGDGSKSESEDKSEDKSEVNSETSHEDKFKNKLEGESKEDKEESKEEPIADPAPELKTESITTTEPVVETISKMVDRTYNYLNKLLYLGSIKNNNIFDRIAALSIIGAGDEDQALAKGLWISGLYGRSKQGKLQNIDSYRGCTKGITIGFDIELGEDLLGIAYRNTQSKFQFRVESNDKINISSHDISLYGHKTLGKAFALQGVISAARNDSTIKATRTIGNVRYNSSGEYGNYSYNVETLLNYTIRTNNGITIIPNIGLRYGWSQNGIYNEIIDTQNISTSLRLQSSFSGTIGTRMVLLPLQITDSITIKPSLYGGITRNFNHKNQKVISEINWGHNSIAQTTTIAAQPKINYNIGANILIERKNAKLLVEYNCYLQKKYQSHQGSIKIKFTF